MVGIDTVSLYMFHLLRKTCVLHINELVLHCHTKHNAQKKQLASLVIFTSQVDFFGVVQISPRREILRLRFFLFQVLKITVLGHVNVPKC